MEQKIETGALISIIEQYFSSEADSTFFTILPNLFQRRIKTLSAVEVARKIQCFLLSTPNRFEVSALLIATIEQHKSKKELATKVQELKTSIVKLMSSNREDPVNWKDIICGAQYTKLVAAQNTEIVTNFRMESSFRVNDGRQKLLRTFNTRVSAAMASTFFTNSNTALKRNNQVGDIVTSHIMDSCYCAEQRTGTHSSRLYFAIADGLGGHLGDPAEDKRISRASYFACKNAVRTLSTFQDPNQIKLKIPVIVKELSSQIKLKNNQSLDSTTLTAAVAFEENLMMRVIGFNIGDSMLISWHPKSKTLMTLLPGRQLVQSMGQGPANLPANYSLENEVDIVDILLPLDTVLIPFTDGMIDIFKILQHEEVKAEKKYTVISLCPEDIAEILSRVGPEPSTHDCLKTLMEEVRNRSEVKRLELTNQSSEAKKQLQLLLTDEETSKLFKKEKDNLTSSYDKAFMLWKSHDLTDDEYHTEKAKLDFKKLDLQQRERAHISKINEFEALTEIRHGDDLGVMVIKF